MLADDEIALRRLTDRDVPDIAAACQDPDIPRWTSVPSPNTEEDARAFVAAAAEEACAVVDRRIGG